MVKNFRDLKVWQKSHRLVLDVYKLTDSFPRQEVYGLTSQVRRSAISIPSNIAEGCGRAGDAELARFLQISMGSSSELEYQLLLARDFSFLNAVQYEPINTAVCEVKRMLASFLQTLRRKK